MKLIGIDMGTTSICGVIADARTGGLLESITRANTAARPGKQLWEQIQDPDKIVFIVRSILDGFFKKHGKADGIGMTGQMHGIVYVDAKGHAVSPLFTWQDNRGGLLAGKDLSYAALLTKLTGYPCAPGFGLTTHFYNIKNHCVPSNTAGLCTIADYVVMRLTGRESPLLDATQAASLGLFDLKKQAFDTRALAKAKISAALIPKVAPSGTLAGKTAGGIPVYNSIGDNQASVLGSLKDIRKSLLVNMGTGGQVSAWLPVFKTITGLDIRPFPGRGYLAVGPSLCGGKSYAMLEHFFQHVCKEMGLRPKNKLYGPMQRCAEKSKASVEPLIIDTRFSGTRQTPSLRGSIANVTLNNLTPANLVRGVLQGMVDELHGFYASIPVQTRSGLRTLAGSGNGIRNNPLLRDIVEKTFGMRVNIPAHCEEAAFGAALCAGVGCGAFRDFFVAGSVVKYSRRGHE